MCVPGGSPGLGWASAVQKVVTQSARFHTGLTLTVDSFRGAHREQAAADQSLLSAHGSATGLEMVAPVSLYAFWTWCTHTLKHPPFTYAVLQGVGLCMHSLKLTKLRIPGVPPVPPHPAATLTTVPRA